MSELPPASDLTRGLAQSLDRPPPPHAAVSPGRALWIGLLTAGLWPAWGMAKGVRVLDRWRGSIAGDLDDWAKLGGANLPSPRGGAGWVRMLTSCSGGLALLAAACAVWLVVDEPSRAGLLWFSDPVRVDEPPAALAGFVLCLGGSYLLTWLAANLHLRGGRRLLAEMRDGLDLGPAARPVPRWEWGVGVLSATAGAGLAYAGMIWALPMLVAATAGRRVAFRHDRQLARRLGGLVAGAAGAKRPAERPPEPAGRSRHCPRDGCDAILADDAAFCPRCGLAVRAEAA